MTTHEWLQLREHAIELFAGDTPGADLEQRILEHFTEQPARVAQAIESIGRRVAAGSVRSGWAILRNELDQKTTDIRVTDDHERVQQTRLAELWITNTGGYFDRDTEVHDELFGPRGRLRTWANQTERITTHWATERPRFQAAEAESIERQRLQGDNIRRLRAMLTNLTRLMPSSAEEPSLEPSFAAPDLTYLDQIAPADDIDWGLTE